MITARAFAGRRYGVFGLARSGRACVAALLASGAEVRAWDDSAAARADFDGLLTDLNTADLAGLDALVVSPGVPHSAPLIVRARAAGLPVIGDIELFAEARAELPPHCVIGITGTNGKSTTTALVHHLLVAAGRPALMAGNIGLALMAQEPLPAGGIYVLELSSYQLDITRSLACDVAILLNLTPDHLERHGSMAGYAAAKARLFAMQGGAGIAIVNRAADAAWGFTRATAATVRYLEDSAIPGDQADWPALQGPHNLENVRAAVAAVRALGLDDAAIAAGLASYPGLAHRMQPVASIGGVAFVNDSKATNADSTAPALAAYGAIHWIAGGRPKLTADGRADLAALLPHLARVRAAYLIGEAAALFAPQLAAQVPVVMSATLARAVVDAAAAARPGETVLLSPACASFDQFSDFEARGAAFCAAVRALTAGAAA